jgi:hypothetical protein
LSDWLGAIAFIAFLLVGFHGLERLHLAGAIRRVRRWAQENHVQLDEQAKKLQIVGSFSARMEVQGTDAQGAVRRYMLRVSPRLARNALLDVPVVNESRIVSTPARRA